MGTHPHRITLGLLAALCLGLVSFQAALAAQPAAAATVVNAASYGEVVAPGSIAALFSSNMTSAEPQGASAFPLPTTLAGLSVTVGGIPAPLFYASAGQINLQVPGALAAGAAAVQVFAAGIAAPVATGTVNIAESAPGVFTLDLSGGNQATALNADYSLNADFDARPGSRPELTGQYVTIYATGLGRTNPLVADGQPASAAPLPVSDGVTTVTIGGVNAQVLYSGLAPGYVGLWQINAVLPGSLPTNLATSLRIELKGRQSQASTLAVANRSEFGELTGVVVNALDGAPVSGAGLALQPQGGGKTRAAVSDLQGRYRFYVIAAGAYNLSAAAAGFIPASEPVAVAGGGETQAAALALTAPLAAGQYRVVVTWANEGDFDAHLTGPQTGQTRFHVWWNGETAPPAAQIDRDDLTGAGPETITFTPQPAGIYRFSVQNYTSRDVDGSLGFAAAKVLVRVYAGAQQVALFAAPSGGGTLWKVFELSQGALVPVNQLADEPDPSNIRLSY
jgi:uncharacterized protein (TIGR03437 family)